MLHSTFRVPQTARSKIIATSRYQKLQSAARKSKVSNVTSTSQAGLSDYDDDKPLESDQPKRNQVPQRKITTTTLQRKQSQIADEDPKQSVLSGWE
jgi:hypothetical protein